jgi:hypothetical protein
MVRCEQEFQIGMLAEAAAAAVVLEAGVRGYDWHVCSLSGRRRVICGGALAKGNAKEGI